jgi:hypothetical protein
MRTDFNSNMDVVQSISPAAKTASGNGTGVDCANYGEVEILFLAGIRTDGTHTPTVEESDTLGSGYATVAAADLVGTTPVAITTDSVQRIGYVGKKRYVRAVVTVAGATTGAIYGAWVVRGGARKQALP